MRLYFSIVGKSQMVEPLHSFSAAAHVANVRKIVCSLHATFDYLDTIISAFDMSFESCCLRLAWCVPLSVCCTTSHQLQRSMFSGNDSILSVLPVISFLTVSSCNSSAHHVQWFSNHTLWPHVM